MAVTIDVRELPARLQEALDIASAGDEVILAEGTTPRARRLPLQSAAGRVAGLHAGAIEAAADFGAPLPDEFWAGRL